MSAPTGEGAILNAIEEGLRWHRCLVLRIRNVPIPVRQGKNIVGLRRADPSTLGIADLCVILPPDGETWWLEVKKPGSYQSPEQKAFAARLEAVGGHYSVVRSWEDTVAAISTERLLRAWRVKPREAL